MVHIEEGGLRPFEQDGAARLQRIGDSPRPVSDERERAGGEGIEDPAGPGMFGLPPFPAPAEQPAPHRNQPAESAVAEGRPPQVAETHPPAPDLVLVGGADAPAGRADPLRSQPRLFRRLDFTVDIQDEVGAIGEQQPGGGIETGLPERVHLGQQRLGIHHAAVADDRTHSGMQDRGRQQVDDQRASLRHHGVAGVVAPAETHHHVEPRRQQIHDLALAFVPPLGPDDDGAGHGQETVRAAVRPRKTGGMPGSRRYSSPRSSRTSLSSRTGVRAGLNPMCRRRTTPSRSAM